MAAPGVDDTIVDEGPPSPPARDPSRTARLFGLVGSLLMAGGALGSGALPVPNPLFGIRVLSLPSRNATVAIAITYAGIGMVVLAWLWIGKMLRENGAVAPAPTRAQLSRTAVLWAIPLALAPPLFSRDVYSYLAQSATLARGLDPYTLGPAEAFGVDDPLVRSIPTIWRDTGAPYGPFFLVLGRGITALTGNDIVAGVFAHRALALVGVAMIVWVLPKLARRCGLDVGLAMWLGVANPLVLFHLVSGMHNESLMVGLMLVGFEVGLRAGERWWDPYLLGGGVLIVLASAVKLPALLALGFLGIEWARRRGGRVRDVAIAATLFTAIAVLVYAAFGYFTGLGLRWLDALGAPSLIRSWLSISTDFGLLGGQVGIILGGLGDHTDAVLSLTRAAGLVLAALLAGRLMLAVLRGRLDAITGMAAGMAAVVVLSPIVHPWYLLWAVIPLAATKAMPKARRAMLVISGILAIVVPPTGADFNFRAYQLPMSIIAGLLVLALSLLVVRRSLAGRTGVDVDAWPGRVPAGRPQDSPGAPL
ncbi:polyprenol phosphomannose-dependent alpha 1,6 mannosyltransferase MptB [Pseudonocardia abyssalis]|uniref:Polyprenol phosphomannose-dependent alpha 1,6 mannosyltransferase MptB n=1 Tax=Pseudonocardia abyssalis TaxID=2792008 RepID=A0ABS6UPY8_9PSEU|nr:polyprenol phosphomannose-dependent alpha 1,6 mannosyltransferase MptB [Pseudonocardia abyssalis]MBW0115590.1 polyprenol phosphomannose-dependent alpha 1,6 mannosyltransferase MptB [Pseudonocardia abyssalis]MBW0134280.1 polyprenol phosphomannose-dependent alpha 1,6 mannosyltransferase MptB [Pseudonocardia abyssalis]